MRYLSLLALLAACGDDPVQVSDVVDLKLTIASGDVTNGTLQAQKNINTESGNPYEVFMQSARDKIGADPTLVELDRAALTLESTSKNVTALSGVFLGATKLDIIMNGSTTRYPLATHDMSADDGASVGMDVAFDPEAITASDFADLVNGAFKVVVAGAPAAGFATANADADLRMSLTFSAYE